MSTYVAMTDGFPGSWGRGESERAAVEECKRQGGRFPLVVFRLHDAFTSPTVDGFGRIHAEIVPLYVQHAERHDRPPLVAEAWRLRRSPTGREYLDPQTGAPIGPVVATSGDRVRGDSGYRPFGDVDA